MSLLRDERGAALLEFAISLPLLVVFVVGIYDFSGAFNEKQKIEQAAQEGAILAGAQPMSDIQSSKRDPDSLQAVVTAVFNSLVSSGVLSSANCSPPTTLGPAGLAWTYQISGCNSAYPSDNLTIFIDRGSVCASGPACASAPPVAVGTIVRVTYPYHWQFYRVIQLLVPGASYADYTPLTESATVHNQM